MRKHDNLALHEEILLLALENKKGTTAIESHLNLALGGAILAELLLLGRIQVQKEKKKQFAIVSNTKPTGDPLLDDCLGRIAESKKRQQLKAWVTRFSNIKKLKRRVAAQLCRKGIVRESEDRVLLIFKRAIFPEIDPRPERALVERLRQAIFAGTSQVEPRSAVLVALAFHGDLLKNAFEKKMLKSRKKRIESLAGGEVVGAATKEAVQAVKSAAAMVAIRTATGV
jgi:Golgi phosphoprotein 3